MARIIYIMLLDKFWLRCRGRGATPVCHPSEQNHFTHINSRQSLFGYSYMFVPVMLHFSAQEIAAIVIHHCNAF